MTKEEIAAGLREMAQMIEIHRQGLYDELDEISEQLINLADSIEEYEDESDDDDE